MERGTKVYYYLITSNNEKYREFNQVVLRSVDGNNEVVMNMDPNFQLMVKAFMYM